MMNNELDTASRAEFFRVGAIAARVAGIGLMLGVITGFAYHSVLVGIGFFLAVVVVAALCVVGAGRNRTPAEKLTGVMVIIAGVAFPLLAIFLLTSGFLPNLIEKLTAS